MTTASAAPFHPEVADQQGGQQQHGYHQKLKRMLEDKPATARISQVI